jgi:hypothetical protein
MPGGRPRKYAYDDLSQRRVIENEVKRIRRAERGGDHKPTIFRGVDGEGSGRGRAHAYQLLSVGNVSLYTPGVHLHWSRIFDFLYGQFDPALSFVGFYMGYDFNQWFRTLPQNRAEILLDSKAMLRRKMQKGPHYWPVRCDGWEFDTLAMKRVKIRPQGCDCRYGCQHKNKIPWMNICDAGPFFQESFLSVIDPRKWTEPVCTPEEYAQIKYGKEHREDDDLGEHSVAYNILENDVLARVMGRLSTGLRANGVYLGRDQWFGPGQAAQASLRNTEAPNKDVLSEPRFASALTWGRKAYYGGWFELMAHGHIPGVSYEYDINSAYPYVIARLPCLLHSMWQYECGDRIRALEDRGTAEKSAGRILRIVHARVAGSDSRIGAMLHRHDDGRIVRPRSTGGYYWQHELDAAVRAGLIDHAEVLESMTFRQECDCRPPLWDTEQMYLYRQRIGKNTPEGKAAKLVFNSRYGKFAQSEGEPTYANSIYASLITAGCRTMILDAIATHPEGTRAVLMVATDGVYFRSPHPALTLSTRLGDWEMSEKHNLTLFKPGVYWDDAAREAIARRETPKFKSRGVSARAFGDCILGIDAHFSRWDGIYPPEKDPDCEREGWFPRVTFRTGFSMISCKQALQRGQWYLAGAVGSADMIQDSDPIAKRRAGEYSDGVYWSRPHDGWSFEPESFPYLKTFGQAQVAEHEKYGIDQDGFCADSIARYVREL